jgi:hypothetical protein
MMQERNCRLSEIFRGESPEVAASIARLYVLIEDLRIEITGFKEKKLRPLDATSVTLRQIYFLRRSIATLEEFSDCLVYLDENRKFGRVKLTFREGVKEWQEAISFFRARKHKLHSSA